MTVRKRAGRAVHVESHLHELRDDPLHLLVRRPLLHHHNHNTSLSNSHCQRHSPVRPPTSRVPRRPTPSLDPVPIPIPVTPTPRSSAIRSSRRASSMIRSNSRLIAPSSSGPRLIVLHVARALPPRATAGRPRAPRSSSRGRSRARTSARALSSATSCSSMLVDPPPQLVEPVHSALFSHRTYSPARSRHVWRPRRVPRSRCTSALPTTAASADAAGLRDVLRATRCRSRARPAATTAPAPARSGRRRPPRRSSRTPVTPSREIDIEKPAPELRRPPDPLVGRRRADQEDRIEPGVEQRRAQRLRFLDRIVEDQHAVHAGVAGRRARTPSDPSARPGSRR